MFGFVGVRDGKWQGIIFGSAFASLLRTLDLVVREDEEISRMTPYVESSTPTAAAGSVLLSSS